MHRATYILGVFFLIIISAFVSCSNNVVDPLLIGCWTHSHEEAANNEPRIYRPCDFKDFPPSRYRNTFTLRADGTCDYLVLAPNDAHFFVEGIWEIDATQDTITIIGLDSNILSKRLILEYDDSRLLLNTL